METLYVSAKPVTNAGKIIPDNKITDVENTIFRIWFYGNTFVNKNEIKELGYKWTEQPEEFKGMYDKAWSKEVKGKKELTEELKKAITMGAKLLF